MSKNESLPTMIVWHEHRKISYASTLEHRLQSRLKVECRMSISEAISGFRSVAATESEDEILHTIMKMHDAWLE